MAGLKRSELFRCQMEAEVEFMTLMRFASWDAVKAFAGPDWEVSVVPAAARAALAGFDERATHYKQRVGRGAQTRGSAATRERQVLNAAGGK